MKNHWLRNARSLLCLLVLWPVVCVGQIKMEEKIQSIDRAFSDAHSAMRAVYRKSMTELFGSADKIEVFLLDFEVQNAPEIRIGLLPPEFFPILPYTSKSKILQRKTLSLDEMRKLLPPLREAVAVEKNHGGALCHYPIHGVRLWSGETLIFQSSFCWVCENFYVAYPDSTAGWLGIETKELKQVMNELMPIPEKESERFRKMNEPKPAPKKKKK